MSKYCEENLIDLSLDNEHGQVQHGTSSKQMGTNRNSPNETAGYMRNAIERESLDNNPFDLVQKLANRPQDPFDIVEKEACIKARYSMHQTHEVKIGKLLSLSDDNILDEVDSQINSEYETTENEKTYNGLLTSNDTSFATIYHTAIVEELDSESPPVLMSMKSTSDTCSSAMESDDSSANSVDGYSAKIRRALENRKRLLKLSIANSTFNSPLSCRSQPGNGGFSAMFPAAAHFSEQMLASESPLKFVEDDAMNGQQPSKFANAEQDFEADLKMLSIPMLRKLPSPVPEEMPLARNREVNDKEVVAEHSMTPPDLSMIREKLREKRMNQPGKDQDIMTLIDKLKTLLCDNDGVDVNKKNQANCLLQKLGTLLYVDERDNLPKNASDIQNSTKEPQSIVRQETFDIELQPSASDINVPHVTRSPRSALSLSPPKEIPETMLKSSATYDSEPIAERENLLLPHVETISPITSPHVKGTLDKAAIATASHPDIHDIIEQISKLFEQHQSVMQSSQINDGGNSGDSLAAGHASQTSAICNPTFIVVMPTNNLQQQQSISNHQNISSVCENFFDEMKNSDSAIRRRSQSLSLHDKVKIVQLPVCVQSGITQMAKISPNVDVEELIQKKKVNAEIKTPIRPQRRNSISLGPPHTPLTSLNHGTGIPNSLRLAGVPIQKRFSIGSNKVQTNETQHRAVVHPIPRANWNAFKPDLKRKGKQQSTSVMTSKAPLKALMPIKKVTPMLTTKMATPEKTIMINEHSLAQKPSMETSMHLLTKSDKISYTSTPMPAARSTDQINGIPNACSTPAFASGAAATATATSSSGTAAKKNSRFSAVSTPASKLQQPHATSSSSGLKKRPLPELMKAYSPVRMRNSLAGMSVQAVRSKQSIKLPNSSKHTDLRPNVRPNMRPSFGGSATNKENKQP